MYNKWILFTVKDRDERGPVGSKVREVRKMDDVTAPTSARSASMPPSGGQMVPTEYDVNGNPIYPQFDASQPQMLNGVDVANQPLPAPQQMKEKPRFVSTFGDLLVREGEAATLGCEIGGSEPVSVRWFKDNAEVRLNTPGYQLSNSGGLVSLTVNKATSSFAGRYMCVLKNTYGHASIHAQLKVDSQFTFCSHTLSPMYLL